MPEEICAIGVDLGGTKIEAGLVDRTGRLQKRIRMATLVKGGPTVIQNQIISAVNDLRQMANDQLIGVGIGVAGQVDAETGFVRFAPNLDWHDVPFQENLKQAIGLPLAVLNDVQAATWGEWQYGAGKDCQDLVCVFVGTGIGGGIVSGGHMLTGCSNTCGEIGHMTIDFGGQLCTCGNRGCFESLAGGWAIARSAQEAISKDRIQGAYILQLAEGDIDKITAKMVADAAQVQDGLALQLMEQVKQALIAGCISLVNAFNPCRLILGGGFLEGTSDLIPLIETGVRQHALSTATIPLQVLPAKLRGEAGVVGSAAYAMQRFSTAELLQKG